ncbi:MAG: hypothetical protein DRJ51_07955 [Thermoprotei archaeon]|nr:MAG: hypothetical protein DRJ51_07955 [Thermoprotei archaeon]
MKANYLQARDRVKIDEKVGAGLAKLVEGENLSVHVAIVSQALKPHYHKLRDEVYIIIEGNGVMFVGEDEFEVTAGDVILIPKGNVHSIRPKNKGEKIVFLFASSPPFDPEHDRFFVER